MATQEERLTALERTFANFQKESVARTQEIEENTTIMLGVMRAQGQDIRRIFERLDKVENHLTTMDQRLDRIEAKFEEHTSLLTQILARLPQNPS